jgi:hypothetical protein
VIYTPIAGDPAIAHILPVHLTDGAPARIDHDGSRHACEVAVHPEDSLPDLAPAGRDSLDPPGSEFNSDEL